MKPGSTQSDEAKQKTGRGSVRAWQRRKAVKVALADVYEAELTGIAGPVAKPFQPRIRDNYMALVEDQGGEDQISTARRSLAASDSRLLLAEFLCSVRIQQNPNDLDAMARLTAIVNARRSLLGALGLDRTPREVPRLQDYLASKAEISPTTDTATIASPRNDSDLGVESDQWTEGQTPGSDEERGDA